MAANMTPLPRLNGVQDEMCSILYTYCGGTQNCKLKASSFLESDKQPFAKILLLIAVGIYSTFAVIEIKYLVIRS